MAKKNWHFFSFLFSFLEDYYCFGVTLLTCVIILVTVNITDVKKTLIKRKKEEHNVREDTASGLHAVCLTTVNADQQNLAYIIKSVQHEGSIVLPLSPTHPQNEKRPEFYIRNQTYTKQKKPQTQGSPQHSQSWLQS